MPFSFCTYQQKFNQTIRFVIANVIFAFIMLGALLPQCHYHIKSSVNVNDKNDIINKFLQDHCWFGALCTGQRAIYWLICGYHGTIRYGKLSDWPYASCSYCEVSLIKVSLKLCSFQLPASASSSLGRRSLYSKTLFLAPSIPLPLKLQESIHS